VGDGFRPVRRTTETTVQKAAATDAFRTLDVGGKIDGAETVSLLAVSAQSIWLARARRGCRPGGRPGAGRSLSLPSRS
jgi:hypothetical protein